MSNTEEENVEDLSKKAYTVLPPSDHSDRTLRRVEKDVLVPVKMRDKAKKEKCTQEVQDFTKCCQDSSIAMVIKCREENKKLRSCLTKWYEDPDFRKLCEEEYLAERTEFRKTGKKSKNSRVESTM